MGPESIIYLTNIVICTILACLLTHFWWRQGRTTAMLYWMLSAWVMTVADILFAVRPELPHWVGRLAPTLLVTVGHAGLLLGTQMTAKLRVRPALAGLIVAVHAAGLIYFLLPGSPSSWRMVFNGVIWGGLSLASALCLQRAQPVFWKSIVSPATALLAHGFFHGLRVSSAALFAVQGWREATEWLQILGDLEVSFFMVALFVGLLMANLQQRQDELSSAHAELQTLSGLLPICAWCKKVRDDDGYWQRVEDYFASRSGIVFTHGMCAECLDGMRREDAGQTDKQPAGAAPS